MTRLERAAATIAARATREGSAYFYDRADAPMRIQSVCFKLSLYLYRYYHVRLDSDGDKVIVTIRH